MVGSILGQLGTVVVSVFVGIIICVVDDVFGPILYFSLSGYVASGPYCTVVLFWCSRCVLCSIDVVRVGVGCLAGSVAVCSVGGAKRFLGAIQKICLTW
jgi:hypothetical protein